MTDRFTFFPFSRPSLLTVAARPSSGDQRLLAPLSAEIFADGVVSGSAITLTSGLRGPGDVRGFDISAISAVDPDTRSTQFETNYLPYVEFLEADFPWRYTLDTGGSDGRLQPWLMLVALKADEFEVLAQGDAPLPAIRVLDAAASLPPVTDGRFTTHVHVSGEPQGASAVAVALGTGSRARMLCHRRLAEATAYTLFLVPTYEQGRLAGLGAARVIATPFDAPAWSTGAIDLPYYFSHRFVTNAGEDVEEMVRRLRPLVADEVTHLAAPDRIDASSPGHYAGYRKNGAEFSRRAATNAPGTTDPAFGTDPQLATLIAATLSTVITSETTDDTRDARGAPRNINDPLVTFPAYGWRFREERTLNQTQAGRYWFDRVNLDLPFRDAAQRGAAVVRKHQDEYMRLAWAQYEEIVAANRKLMALEAAEKLVKRIADRRFVRLNASDALALAEPLLDVVPGSSGRSSLSAVLKAAGAPTAYVSREMRRLASKRMRPVSPDAPRTIPVPSIPGDRDAKGIGRIDRSREGIIKRATIFKPVDDATRQGLTAVMKADLLERQVSRSGAIPVAPFSVSDLSTRLADVLKELPRAKADTQITGRSDREKDRLAPIYRSPVIPDALADRLCVLDPDAILPGLSKLPENTVSFYEEDRAFIEAAIVGANHEMNAELRWRGFPTDMRGTVFRRFWQRGYPDTDPRGDDIGPIHTWRGALGANPPSHDRDQAENLIMVIKGDLVRKLRLLIVELNVATGSDYVRGQGTTHEPIFMGHIGDAVYFGFDISRDAIMAPSVRDKAYVVMYEPPGRLRFGLDTATQSQRVKTRQQDHVRLRFPVHSLGSGRSFQKEPRKHSTPPLSSPPFITWNDFSWHHARLGAAGYLDFTSTQRPASGLDHWGADKSSASIALSLWQRPIVAILPLRRVL